MKGKPATAELRAYFHQSDDRTFLKGKYHTAPIKIAKSFQMDQELGIIVMDVSPGMLEGDNYSMEWFAGQNTSLYVTNQSFTKVHPCPNGGRAEMRQLFQLDQSAFVQYMPQPSMLYQDAEYMNTTVVRLAPGAVWMQAEVLCPGRTHLGERFKYRHYQSALSVYYQDEMIFNQRQRIVPSSQNLQEKGAWEEQTHWGTFYVFSDRINSSHVEAIREKLQSLPQTPKSEVLFGVTLTYRHGLVVTASAQAAWPLQETLECAFHFIRKTVFGKGMIN
ncbi:urease accessory protein UreD [Paenibacillus sp. JW14]|uniref:Urease accessory protein UreD n=2 Tax=Paenibacillus agri TaxID=2744309 RepID=A0A850EQP2_9BACL|nr:urease accessory protein UreD [Paenibacillus agri]